MLNVDSRQINNKRLIKLASAVDKELAQADVDGVVVTHGTDTLEETAYFLSLTLKADKPVVLTAAQRQFTTLSSDSPKNFLQAVIGVAGGAGGDARVALGKLIADSFEEVDRGPERACAGARLCTRGDDLPCRRADPAIP